LALLLYVPGSPCSPSTRALSTAGDHGRADVLEMRWLLDRVGWLLCAMYRRERLC
jgi:hypothetical protein